MARDRRPAARMAADQAESRTETDRQDKDRLRSVRFVSTPRRNTNDLRRMPVEMAP
jgi:hypothetical protein